jgi:hypothetical protein
VLRTITGPRRFASFPLRLSHLAPQALCKPSDSAQPHCREKPMPS